jgi:acetyltransferase
VDAAIVINVTPLLSNPIDVMDQVAQTARRHAKPVLAVIMATEDFYEEMKSRGEHPPVYRFPESAARALSRLSRYAEWRRRPAHEAPSDFAVDDAAVAAILEAAPEGYLSDQLAFRVLRHYGIPLVAGRKVETPQQVLEVAEEIGYPLVLKAIGPELVHKSDVGGVHLDLRTRDDVERALTEIDTSLAAAGRAFEGFLVQEMASDGHEVIFGLSIDERFGPLLMFGLGGKYVEVLRDVRFGVTPLAPSEARDMIRGLRGFPLLEGVRGEPPADLDRLEEILLRLAQLADRHRRIRELDINPFLAAPKGVESKALDVRIRVGPLSG